MLEQPRFQSARRVQQSTNTMDTLSQDVTYALRVLVRTPSRKT
ncbi:hypothetical protein SBA4_220021 [Candidatus Sulfopaludibacter sp. SbA4]|nr:hypothetical protein SBA4_220021 [Candidatus Sulfopaludibacter sp. SbA4]